jgi:hypothetical protein
MQNKKIDYIPLSVKTIVTNSACKNMFEKVPFGCDIICLSDSEYKNNINITM